MGSGRKPEDRFSHNEAHIIAFILLSGDVILSVNGERVGEATHKQLVNKIKRAGDSLRYNNFTLTPLPSLDEPGCEKYCLQDNCLGQTQIRLYRPALKILGCLRVLTGENTEKQPITTRQQNQKCWDSFYFNSDIK